MYITHTHIDCNKKPKWLFLIIFVAIKHALTFQ